MGRGEGTLGFFNFPAKLGEGTHVAANIDLMLSLERFHEEFNHTLVKIFSTKMRITVGGDDFEDTFVEGEEGYIESTTAKVVDHDVRLLVVLIQTICNRSRSRLVDNSHDG